jgi:PAS domain S-box-containing protein
MKDNIEKWLVGIFVAILGVICLVAAVTVRNLQRSLASSDWVNHTHAVIMAADGIVSALHAGEAALRTYLFTGDARDQAAYRKAYSDLGEQLQLALALTRGEPAQRAQFRELEMLIAHRLDFAQAAAQARSREGLEAMARLLAADNAQSSGAEISRRVEKLKEEQRTLLEARDRASYLQAQTTRWTVLTGVVSNFLLLVFVGWLIRDDLAGRRRVAAALAQANAQLESKVSERTAQLEQANQALEHQFRYNQLIINSITDMVFVISKALNITRINPAAVHESGLLAAALVGTPIGRVLAPVPGAAGPPFSPEAILQSLREGREIHDRPAAMSRKDGQTVPVRCSLFPVRDQDKVVAGVVVARRTGAGADSPVSSEF